MNQVQSVKQGNVRWRREGRGSALLCIGLLLATLGFELAAAGGEFQTKTENVFLIITDGLRWQEVFNGADEDLINPGHGGVKDVALLKTNYWRETPEARRAALLPFFWSEIAERGQLWGNQAKGSVAKVANTRKFSYPGYNEVLTGFPDPGINSNDKRPNPNVTVFEWLQQKQARFKGQVVAFGTWDVFPYIFNSERSRIPVWPPWESRFESAAIRPNPELMKILASTTPVFEGVILDSFLTQTALEHVQQRKPRLAFIGFGETDEWAHAGRYDLYLEAAHRVDRAVKRLWQAVQAIPQYRNRTTFIITTDHGRGTGLDKWKDHGEKIDHSEEIWMAVLGPDTPPLGERSAVSPVTQSQIAATIAALVGADYRQAFPQAAAPILDFFSGETERTRSGSRSAR